MRPRLSADVISILSDRTPIKQVTERKLVRDFKLYYKHRREDMQQKITITQL